MNKKFLALLLVGLSFFSCDPNAGVDISEEIDSVTRLNIRLTDAPVELDEVNIDLQKVIIKGPEGVQEIPLETEAGIYDLLDLQNGIDALIANADLMLDEITQVRLVLGENNSVVSEGQSYELKIPSANQSGLKIKVCLDLTDTPQYDLILDFDAAASVKQTGNGKFIMKPVIRVVNPDAKCGDEEEEEEEEDPDQEELPKAITDYLDEQYDGYNFKIDDGTLCDGTEIYAITAFQGNEKIDLAFDLAGNFLQRAVKIEEEELPEAVTAAIEANYSGYAIGKQKTYRIERADAAVWFKLLLKNEEHQVEVIYAEDGTALCETEIEDEEDDEDEEDEITIDDLPQSVLDLLEENYPGYLVASIESQTFCDGTEVYVIEASKEDEEELRIYFDLDWNWWQTAAKFKEADLPTAILETIASDYADYKIMPNQTWEIQRADETLWYRVYLKKNNGGEKFYAIYTAEGTFLCQEE